MDTGDKCEAGWYPDTEIGWDRWWDGSAWSEQRRLREAVPYLDPVPVPHGEPAPGVHIASTLEMNPIPAAAVPITYSLDQNPSINGFQSTVALSQPQPVADPPEPGQWSAQPPETGGFIELHTMAPPDVPHRERDPADQAGVPLNIEDPTIFEAEPQRIGEGQPASSLLSFDPHTHNASPVALLSPLAEMTLYERFLDKAAAFHDSQATYGVAGRAIWWTLLLPIAAFCWAANLPPGTQRRAGICASGCLALAASVVAITTLPRAGSEATSVAGSAFGLALEDAAEKDEQVATPSRLTADDSDDAEQQTPGSGPPPEDSAADSPVETAVPQPLSPTRNTDGEAAESDISSTTVATQVVNPASEATLSVPQFASPADSLTATSTQGSSPTSTTFATTRQRQTPPAANRTPGTTTTVAKTTTTKKNKKSTTTSKTTKKPTTTATTAKPLATQTAPGLGKQTTSTGAVSTTTEAPTSTTATSVTTTTSTGLTTTTTIDPDGLNPGPNVGIALDPLSG